MTTLHDAPDDIVLIRDVKPWYVAKLKEDISSEQGDHEDITSPLVVIASVTVDEFNEDNIDDYTYYVSCVCMELPVVLADHMFLLLTIVYGCG